MKIEYAPETTPPAPVAPREFYINVHPNGKTVWHTDDATTLKSASSYPGGRIAHVREVNPTPPKRRPPRGSDIKPGQIYKWALASSRDVNSLVLHAEEKHGIMRGVAFDHLDAGVISNRRLDSGLSGIVALYPDAHWELGEPVTTVKTSNGAPKPKVIECSTLREGQIFKVGGQAGAHFGNATFVATEDAAKDIVRAGCIREDKSAVFHRDLGHESSLYLSGPVGDYTATLLDSEFNPILESTESSRPLIGSDIKPGDVFAWDFDTDPEVCLCTRVEGDSVYGIYLVPSEFTKGCFTERKLIPTYRQHGLALYPNAKLILGAAVTEIPEA